VEALGSATVICTDKTGTLTAGEMTVTAMWVAGRELEISGSGYTPRGEVRADGVVIDAAGDPALMRALRAAALCNRATLAERNGEWAGSGDPTETPARVAQRPVSIRVAVLRCRSGTAPFSAGRRFMACFRDTGERARTRQGRSGDHLERCASMVTPEEIVH
jgi:magnesium-transporting ATPase (P-type)